MRRFLQTRPADQGYGWTRAEMDPVPELEALLTQVQRFGTRDDKRRARAVVSAFLAKLA